MPELIPQSVTKRVALKLFLSSDHVSAATGKTLAIVLSKNGAAFGNPSAGATNATEIASGWYYVDLSTTDTGTKGPLVVRGTATSCDDCEIAFTVANATNAGFTGVPDAVAGVNTGLPVVGTQVPNATAGAPNGLVIAGTNAPITFSGSGDAFTITSTGGNGHGLKITANGSGSGLRVVGGDTGNGARFSGGATSGEGMYITAGASLTADALALVSGSTANGLHVNGKFVVDYAVTFSSTFTITGNHLLSGGLTITQSSSNTPAVSITGNGTAQGVRITGGTTGAAMSLIGGGTSGAGLTITTTSGDGISVTPTNGNGFTLTADGTSKHGFIITGGTGGTSDGMKLVAGTGGLEIRCGNIARVTDLATDYATAAAVTAVYDRIGLNGVGLTSVGITTGGITSSSFAAGAINSTAMATDVVSKIWMGSVLTESYAAAGAEGTPAQLIYELLSALTQCDISSTTLTGRKRNGSTVAGTWTLNSATAPTSRSRAT
jgi:hypothetical protein